jgi:hypothetical protein
MVLPLQKNILSHASTADRHVHVRAALELFLCGAYLCRQATDDLAIFVWSSADGVQASLCASVAEAESSRVNGMYTFVYICALECGCSA